jgi:uncharacterized RDD family membrane protein YckC
MNEQPAAEMPAPAEAPLLQYQGVAIRFVALLIDVIILGIISAVITAPFRIPTTITITNVTNGTSQITSVTANPFVAFGSLIAVIIDLLYFTFLLGAYGQTVGKMAVKIKVVKEDGTKISYADALVRTILYVIDAIPYIIPYLLGAILIWTSDQKQRLGDRAAHTVVVRT